MWCGVGLTLIYSLIYRDQDNSKIPVSKTVEKNRNFSLEKKIYTQVPAGLKFTIKHIYTLENEKNNVPDDVPKENTFYGVMYSILLQSNFPVMFERLRV